MMAHSLKVKIEYAIVQFKKQASEEPGYSPEYNHANGVAEALQAVIDAEEGDYTALDKMIKSMM